MSTLVLHMRSGYMALGLSGLWDCRIRGVHSPVKGRVPGGLVFGEPFALGVLKFKASYGLSRWGVKGGVYLFEGVGSHGVVYSFGA